jgi:hypothetical protein
VLYRGTAKPIRLPVGGRQPSGPNWSAASLGCQPAPGEHAAGDVVGGSRPPCDDHAAPGEGVAARAHHPPARLGPVLIGRRRPEPTMEELPDDRRRDRRDGTPARARWTVPNERPGEAGKGADHEADRQLGDRAAATRATGGLDQPGEGS